MRWIKKWILWLVPTARSCTAFFWSIQTNAVMWSKLQHVSNRNDNPRYGTYAPGSFLYVWNWIEQAKVMCTLPIETTTSSLLLPFIQSQNYVAKVLIGSNKAIIILNRSPKFFILKIPQLVILWDRLPYLQKKS